MTKCGSFKKVPHQVKYSLSIIQIKKYAVFIIVSIKTETNGLHLEAWANFNEQALVENEEVQGLEW